MKIEEIRAKSILVKSKLPDADYVVNPYTGCQFACQYCYASFMGRFVNESFDNWGNYVYVKVNAVELLDSEITRMSRSRRSASVLLSSVTDPYHGVEAKYQLSRGILRVFVEKQYPGIVGILTKSPLVLRDIDIIEQLPNAEVGMTVTTTDDKLSRFLETKAPLASRRLEALEQLNSRGIRTYAFVGPLLPHFRYQPDLLDDLFSRIAQTGVKHVYVEHINLRAYIRNRLWDILEHEPPEVQAVYREASTNEHRAILDGIVAGLMKKYGLELRLGATIYHNADKAS